jgi:hypothetical protein
MGADGTWLQEKKKFFWLFWQAADKVIIWFFKFPFSALHLGI